ncbi:hypothetical protein ACO11K_002673 [Bacillus cytotoxicus]
MEENNKNLGKKVAISVMSVALLGTSGYLIYDKGFNKTGKETLKLASNTEEKKNDRITGGNGLHSMFPNLVTDPTKKDEKPGEKPNINLADLIGNNKSPITPVTYKPDEVSVEKKDPEIKLSDAPTPPKMEAPINMGGPMAEPSKNLPDDLVDQTKTPTPIELPQGLEDKDNTGDEETSQDTSNTGGNGNSGKYGTPEDSVNIGGKETSKDKETLEDKGNTGDDSTTEPEKPAHPHPTITVSPKTGDILVEWYAGNGKYYSSVFFNDYFGSQKEPHSNTLTNLTNYNSKKEDWTLVSQLNTPSKAKTIAEHKLAVDNLDKILARGNYSNHRELFYLRNQINVLNESVTTQEELQKYLNKDRKAYIQFITEKVYQTAIEEEFIWLNTGDTASLEQALSKYYLVTSVFESVDSNLVEDVNQHVENIFNKLLQEELQNIDIQTEVVASPTDKKVAEEANSSHKEQTTKGDNPTTIDSEKKSKDQLINDTGASAQKKLEKTDPIDKAIEEIETYLKPESPQYENVLLLVNQWIHVANDEQQQRLNQQFQTAVTGLLRQVKEDPNVLVDDALKKANLLVNTERIEKSVQDEANKLLMPLMFEKKANDAANEEEYYTAVLNIANAIRTKHPLERSREEMVKYANKLWEKTESEWANINGTAGWQEKVEKKVLPSYILLAQLKDIDKTIEQIVGMEVIDKASKKMEGIQLLQVASAKVSQPDQLYDALHYYGQAAYRGVHDKKGFSNVATRILKQAEANEKSNYVSALEIYQILYKTPGIELTGVKDRVTAAIDYLSTFDAANKKAARVNTIEDLASVIELTHQSIKLGFQQATAKQLMKDVSGKMLQTGEELLTKNDNNNAYKCFEFLTRPQYATTIDGELRQKAIEHLNKIKEMDAQK